MAEVMFKLLRCDAEASHLLGWAKNEVKRLIDHAGLPAFNRTWALGDVTVRAQYFGGLARLWLEAVNTERLAVWATLPNPYPYRGVAIGVTPINSTNGVTRVVATDTEVLGTEAQTTDFDLGFMRVKYRPVSTWFGGDFVEMYEYRASPPNTYVYDHDLVVSTPQDCIAMSDAYQPPEYPGGGATFVSAVNPTPTSSVITINGPGGTNYIYGAFSYVESLSNWNGHPAYAGYPTLYERTYTYDRFTWSYDPWALYDGVQVPLLGYYSGSTFVVIEPKPLPIGYLALQPEYLASAANGADYERFLSRWQEGQRQNRERRVMLLKTHSAAWIEQLGQGIVLLPATWDYQIKLNAPWSAYVHRAQPITEVVTDTTVYDVDPVRVIQRTATLEYTGVTNGEPVQRQQTITGTYTRVRAYHDDTSPAGADMQSYTHTYENWYVTAATSNPSGTNAEPYLSHAFLADSFPYGMGAIWNGEWVQAIGNSDHKPDSSFGTPFYAVGYTTLVPPLPSYRNSLVPSVPELVAQYHREYRPRQTQEVNTFAERKWLSASLTEAMAASIILFSPVKDEQALGIFAAVDDRQAAQQIEVYGVVHCVYDNRTGTWKSIAWTPLAGGPRRVPVALVDGVWPEANALIIYSGIKWDDVKETARAQRKALADPNDPAHDPLMKAVLTALTPAE